MTEAAPPTAEAEGEVDSTQAMARTVLGRVTICLKLATMHQLANTALQAPMKALLEIVNPALEGGGAVALQLIDDSFFMNREIIKLDFSSFESSQALRTILRRLGAHEIAISAPLSDGELRDFLATFQRHYLGATPKEILKERPGKVMLRTIAKTKADAFAGEIDARQNVVRCYALTAMAVQKITEGMASGKPVRLGSARRAIQALSDAAVDHESLLVGITRFPGLSGQPHFHLATTAALTLLMGRRLGLPRDALGDLCMSALFHDVARSDLHGGEKGLEDASSLSSQRLALLSLLRLSTLGTATDNLERIAITQEVLAPAERTGEFGPTVAARLISVACAYDLMTNVPPPKRGLLPDQALRIILDKAGTRFGPRATKLFAGVVGLFPVGTTVELTGGVLAVVLEAPEDPARFSRPRVKVVRDASGRGDYVVDLSDPKSNLQILRSVDPVEQSVDVPQFLLA